MAEDQGAGEMSGFDPKGKTRRVRPQYMPADVETTQPLRRTRLVCSQRTTELPATEARPLADILHLAEAVPIVRQQLDVPIEFTDDAIFSSLKTIAARSSDRERWRAAFGSNLARYLSIRGRDLGQALQQLIALIPPPRV